jgi:translation initiation factor IF-1
VIAGLSRRAPAAKNVVALRRVSKEELVHLEGEVVLIAKGGNFRVKLENGHEVLAKLAGKVRRHRIRVVLGDRVTVAVSPYDPTRGFIVYRQR